MQVCAFSNYPTIEQCSKEERRKRGEEEGATTLTASKKERRRPQHQASHVRKEKIKIKKDRRKETKNQEKAGEQQEDEEWRRRNVEGIPPLTDRSEGRKPRIATSTLPLTLNQKCLHRAYGMTINKPAFNCCGGFDIPFLICLSSLPLHIPPKSVVVYVFTVSFQNH